MTAISPSRGILARVKPWRIVGSVVVVLVVLFAIGPVLWTIGTSLKPSGAVFSGSWSFVPTFANYGSVAGSGFLASLVHSVIIDAGATIVTMAVALPGAYALVRQSQRRIVRAVVNYNYLIRILPGLIILVPLFVVFRTLHLLNSYPGMIVAYQVIGVPIAMATMMAFFSDVPKEIEDAALVDGASTLGTFARVALPLARSGAIATAVLVFVMDWTEFLFALVLTGNNTVTAPVAILNFLKYSNVDWGALAGATVILMLPSVLLSLATGRLFVRGLTSGAVK